MDIFDNIDADERIIDDDIKIRKKADKIYDFLTIQCIICILLVILYLIANIVRTQWAKNIKDECNRLMAQDETIAQSIVDFTSKAYETITKSKPLEPVEAVGGDVFYAPVEDMLDFSDLAGESKDDGTESEEKAKKKDTKDTKEKEVAIQVIKSEEIGLISPLSGIITSKFGKRADPFSDGDGFHYGVDIENEIGTKISATAKGKVIVAQENELAGKYIEIDHGNGIISRYLHCNKILVKEGDNVKRGQTIAELGNTGRSTGPHLHFELRYDGTPFDPLAVIKIND